MKATTKLQVTPGMQMTVTIELNVSEADALLEATKNVERWPMGRFRECFQQALAAARSSYESEHVTD